MPSQTRRKNYATVKTRRTRTARQRKPTIIGINYEAGKSIQHVRYKKNCLGYANIQIVMDAPFQGRVANEKVRGKSRSELQMENYKEDLLIKSLTNIFEYINREYPNIKLVIQIARGRSWESMFNEVILPILNTLEIPNYEIKSGYRRKNYWTPSTDEPFIYVNIGMFAILSNKDAAYVGEICNPVETRNILDYTTSFILSPVTMQFRDSKNILLRFPEIKQMYLYGISDTMPFITPNVYKSEEEVKKLLNI